MARVTITWILAAVCCLGEMKNVPSISGYLKQTNLKPARIKVTLDQSEKKIMVSLFISTGIMVYLDQSEAIIMVT